MQAEKHEKNPSTLKKSKFSETIELGSASAWKKFSLVRFGVDFDQMTLTELNTLIKDPQWYNPETEIDPEDFLERAIPVRHG